MNLPITISVDESSLHLKHQAPRGSEHLTTHDFRRPRWRAAAKQMLSQVGANRSEWNLVDVCTADDEGETAIVYRFERR